MRWTTLEKSIFAAFIFWFACGLIFTLGRIGPNIVASWNLSPVLQAFVNLCLRVGDPVLILLAFANTHLLAAREWGPNLARRWALIVLALALAVETCGAKTGFPFGAYTYTDRFGPSIGVVPMTIPLAWQVVLTNALFIVRAIAPHLPRAGEAAAVGLIGTLYDAVLEPFAVRVKGYWFWRNATGAVPSQNYLAWFIVGSLLVLVFAPTSAKIKRRDLRPVVLLAATVTPLRRRNRPRQRPLKPTPNSGIASLFSNRNTIRVHPGYLPGAAFVEPFGTGAGDGETTGLAFIVVLVVGVGGPAGGGGVGPVAVGAGAGVGSGAGASEAAGVGEGAGTAAGCDTGAGWATASACATAGRAAGFTAGCG